VDPREFNEEEENGDDLHGLKSPASARSSKSSPNKAKSSERSAAGAESRPHAGGGAEEVKRRPEDFRSTPSIALKRCAINPGVCVKSPFSPSEDEHDSKGWVSRLGAYMIRRAGFKGLGLAFGGIHD
jgi:hypothetical protein